MSPPGWRRPVRMAEAVSATLERLGLSGRIRQEEIWHVWSRVVGPQIARHAQPHAIRHGRLTVHVTDPVWLHHLSMMRHRVIAALNERLSQSVVREMILRIGEVPDLPTAHAPSPASGPEGPGPDPARLAEIESLLVPLGDESLREAVRRLLLRAARRPPKGSPR